MSQGLTEEGAEAGSGLARATGNISRMMQTGRSFSGNERHCVFLNTGANPAAEGRFANVSVVSGLDFPDDGRAVALVDWDQDGDQDLWISNRNAPRLRFLRNDATAGNRFLAVRLEGNGTNTNRDAIGARAEVVQASTELKSIQSLRAGEGFLAQSSKWLHFGLGADARIEKVIVHWPGGEVEEFRGIEADRRYHLRQGTGEAEETSPKPRETRLAPSSQEVHPPDGRARIPLVNLLRFPSSSYVGVDGQERELVASEGRHLLVNLWAGWCAPCVTELDEFARRHEELQAAGLDLVALTVDGLGGDEAAMRKAAQLIFGRDYPFAVGEASPRIIADLKDLQSLQVPLQLDGQLPLPTSFLIDPQGRLAVIYKGRVLVDQLLQDVSHGDISRIERFVRAAPFHGRAIHHPEVRQAAIDTAGFQRFLLADHLQQSGRNHEAARQYMEILELWPDSSWVHNNLGGALQSLGRHEEAIARFKEALRLRPGDAMMHRNIGMSLQAQGKGDEAIAQFHRALQLKPDAAATHAKLGFALEGRGRLVEAITQYRRALELDPEDAATHTRLGVALNRQESFVEAAEHLRTALRLEPDNVLAHASLGMALTAQGAAAGAIHHHQRALELEPDSLLALNALARIRAAHPNSSLRDGARAFTLAERCCELTDYQVPTALATLAAACAELGRFDEAVKWQTKATELAPLARRAAMGALIEHYRNGLPFRTGGLNPDLTP